MESTTNSTQDLRVCAHCGRTIHRGADLDWRHADGYRNCKSVVAQPLEPVTVADVIHRLMDPVETPFDEPHGIVQIAMFPRYREAYMEGYVDGQQSMSSTAGHQI